MTEYKIRELCGDWALDIPMGNDIVVLYFNSRVNAEMVKNVLEWENAHPNEAIPYNTPAIDPESLHRERTVATNADCIRSMSDERLADQLVISVNGLASCKLYLSPPTGRLYRIRTEAVKEVKEWLQQPTEEE